MKIRRPKKTDQQETEKAFQLLMQLVKQHPEIEPTLWVGACISAAANAFIAEELLYEDFVSAMNEARDFYEDYWE